MTARKTNESAESVQDVDVSSYNETGYLVVPGALSAATLELARSEVDRVLAGAEGLKDHTDVYDLDPSHTPSEPRVRRIKNPHRHFSIFMEIARSPEVLEVVSKLIGPNIRLYHSKINIKAAGYGAAVEWHQDWAFYPHTNDDLLTVGVMLDDCTLENGPLMVVPGSHTGPILNHHEEGVFVGAIDPTSYADDIRRAAPVVASAGSLSFHHVRALHGSSPNKSTARRALLLYAYAAVDAWPLRGVTDLAEFDGRIVMGEPTLAPRMEKLPVRVPLPLPGREGSIYELQSQSTARVARH